MQRIVSISFQIQNSNMKVAFAIISWCLFLCGKGNTMRYKRDDAIENYLQCNEEMENYLQCSTG